MAQTVEAAPEAQTATRRGRTICLREAYVYGAASVAGPAEGRGPLGPEFDEVTQGHLLGQRTWEQAESAMLARAFRRLCAKTGWQQTDFDLLLGGDLLNQNVASNFAACDLDVPFCGLYSACATLGEALGLAAALCDAGHCRRVAVTVSSHHDAAERQYRFPTELGNQRPPTAQWTATGAVAVAVGVGGQGEASARITHFTPGRVVDFGVKDPFNMGGAMAPAAADTLVAHLRDLERPADAYGAVFTGDLAAVGVPVCQDLLAQQGIQMRLRDCGRELYDPTHQDVHAGGSGAACSGLVLAARILPGLGAGRYGRVLLCTTGALHSPTTYQQGATIPAVAHAVAIQTLRTTGDGAQDKP